jgi:aldehyde dehydrogenase (NAD+)
VYERVVEAIAERARAIRLGDPRLPETQMGPVANRPQYERIRGTAPRTGRGGESGAAAFVPAAPASAAVRCASSGA